MIKEPSQHPKISRIIDAFSGIRVLPLPRGEVWLGTKLVMAAGYDDTADNHFRAAEDLNHDFVSFPVKGQNDKTPDLGYRYFTAADLAHGFPERGFFLFAVIDGPFQRLVNHMGLVEALMGLIRDREAALKAYAEESDNAFSLIRQCLDRGVNGIIIADDFAGENGPLVSPRDIGELSGPFYTKAVTEIHKAGAKSVLHSCGNLTRLFDIFEPWRLDGLAAVQNRCNDLAGHAKKTGRVVIAGIDSPLLESDAPPDSELDAFKHLISAMAPTGGLVLCSGSGLYKGEFLGRIKALYAMADELSI